MSIPLSQLMQADDPDIGPPTAVHPICLAPSLADDLARLTNEFAQAEEALDRARQDAADPDRMSRPKRQGQKGQVRDLEARASDLAEQADAVRARMAERSIDLHLVANEDRFREIARENPPRDPSEDAAGARRDRTFTGGMCNVDALLDHAEEFIVRYGDESPAGAWAFVRKTSAPGDRDQLAARIVALNTQGIDLGKSRLAWHNDRKTSPDSE